MLINESISTTITELAIFKQQDLANKEDYYAILGKTIGDSTKLACRVILKNNKFFFEESEVNNVIICFGSINCNPETYKSKWICDDGSGKASCTLDCNKKSVSHLRVED